MNKNATPISAFLNSCSDAERERITMKWCVAGEGGESGEGIKKEIEDMSSYFTNRKMPTPKEFHNIG